MISRQLQLAMWNSINSWSDCSWVTVSNSDLIPRCLTANSNCGYITDNPQWYPTLTMVTGYIYVHTHLSCKESQLHICYNNLGYVWGDCRVNGLMIEPHAHEGYMSTDAIKWPQIRPFVSINQSNNEHQRLPPVQEVAATLKNDQSKKICSSCSLHSQK